VLARHISGDLLVISDYVIRDDLSVISDDLISDARIIESLCSPRGDRAHTGDDHMSDECSVEYMSDDHISDDHISDASRGPRTHKVGTGVTNTTS
jgi:hypothetical protein